MKHLIKTSLLLVLIASLACSSQNQEQSNNPTISKYLNNEIDSAIQLVKNEIDSINKMPDKDQIDAAVALNNLACLQFTEGDLQSAKQNFNKSLDLLSNGNKLTKAVALLNMGGFLYKKNIMSNTDMLKEALEYFEEVVDLLEPEDETNYHIYATALGYIGLSNMEFGKYDLADWYMSKAIRVFEGRNDLNIEYANILDNLGMLYMMHLSRMDAAGKVIEKSIEVKDDGYKTSHFNEWLYARGNLIAYYDYLIITKKETNTKKVDDLRKEYEEAENSNENKNAPSRYYRESRVQPSMLVERILPPYSSKSYGSLDVNNLSSMDEIFGEGSFEDYQNLMKGMKDMDMDSFMSQSGEFSKLMNSIKGMGDAAESGIENYMSKTYGDSTGFSLEKEMKIAADKYEKGIAEAQANGTYTPEVQEALTKEYSESIERITAEQGKILGNQILSDFDGNQFLVEMADMSSDLVEKSGGSSNLQKEWAQTSAFMKMEGYKKAGRHKEAIEQKEIYIEQLKELNGMRSTMYLSNVVDLYQYADSLGNYDVSEKYLLKAIDIELESYNDFKYISEKERKAYWYRIQAYKDAFYRLSKKLAGTKPSIVRKAYNLTLSTKSQLLSKTSKIQHVIENSEDKELIEDFRKWVKVRGEIAKAAQLTVEERTAENYDIEELEETANDLEKSLSRKSSLFGQAEMDMEYDWKQVRSSLERGEVAMEIVKFYKSDEAALIKENSKTYYAAMLVDSNTESPKFIEIPNAGDLEGKYFNSYKSFNHTSKARGSRVISSKRGNNNNSSISKSALYNSYWKPIQAALPKGTERIFISASGVYNSINLNTLFNSKSGKYLIDQYSIQYVSSTRELINREKPVVAFSNNSSIALFGYPTYLMAEGEYQKLKEEFAKRSSHNKTTNEVEENYRSIWDLLPGTLSEVNTLNDLFAKYDWEIDKYIEGRAIEEHVKKLKSPFVLHIATHGEFKTDDLDLDPMLRSGLIFAGFDNYKKALPKPKVEDGILTAFEASTLSLDKTELAVLSACETGLGENESGEGVYGLQRAFKIAGAESVLMSLWKVSDEATEKLMINFYENWLESGNKREAFVLAQKSVKSEYPDPYFWGAFVLID